MLDLLLFFGLIWIADSVLRIGFAIFWVAAVIAVVSITGALVSRRKRDFPVSQR